MLKATLTFPLAILLLLPAPAQAETPVQGWLQTFVQGGTSVVAVDGSNSVIVAGRTYLSVGAWDYITIKYSSSGVPLWTNRYYGDGTAWDMISAVAVDHNNDVVVTGASYGDHTGYDYATIKYSGAGVPLWTNRYTGSVAQDDYPTGMAVDGSNNVIVTGYSAPGSGYATVKYSSAGVPVWTNRYSAPGPENALAQAIAADGSNDVVVTGYFHNGANYDWATIKYSTTGAPLWTNLFFGAPNGNDYAYAIAVDGSNDLIVVGQTAREGLQYATIKYTSAGVPLWTNFYADQPTGTDSAKAIAVDHHNNVIVTGWSLGWGTSLDYSTLKYSSAGVPLWTNRYDGARDYDTPVAMAIDASDNVVVAGDSFISHGYYLSRDSVAIKYSPAGLPLWTNRYDRPDPGDHGENRADHTSALAIDSSGNVIVTGYSSGSAFYPDDFTTIKYICVPSPVLTGLQQTDGTFQLRVEDVLQPGTLIIESSTNLADWSPVFTNTTPTNRVLYTDPQTGSNPNCFYQAFQFP